jgi:hypothetical protein
MTARALRVRLWERRPPEVIEQRAAAPTVSPRCKAIARQFGRSERWGRLVKQIGLTGGLRSKNSLRRFEPPAGHTEQGNAAFRSSDH